jgi:SAM-dependent methyltransferase
VEAAYENTEQFPHSHIIQGDIYQLPFIHDFDFTFSIGVLHHLPRPEDGFLSLVKSMKPGTPIFIWLYGKSGKFFRMKVIEGVIRKFTVRMPQRMLYYACYFPAMVYHSFNMAYHFLNDLGLKGLASRMPFKSYARFPFMVKHADSYDLLGTPVNNYYSREDVEKWLGDANLQETWITQIGGWSWRAYGVKK